MISAVSVRHGWVLLPHYFEGGMSEPTLPHDQEYNESLPASGCWVPPRTVPFAKEKVLIS